MILTATTKYMPAFRYAKQLAQLRTSRDRMSGMKTTVAGVGMKATAMASQVRSCLRSLMSSNSESCSCLMTIAALHLAVVACRPQRWRP